MQLGMVGLGRMGANLTRRLMRDGHEVVVSDVSPEAVAQLESEGAVLVLVDRGHGGEAHARRGRPG